MIKKIIAGLSLIGMSLSAHSALIVDESNITGADMAGLEVTAFFEGGSTETVLWSAFPDVILGTGDPIADAEGFSGGAIGTGWSLTQQGFSSGNVNSAGDVLGAWTFLNESASSSIFAFVVSGMDSLIAFDIDSDSIDTPNSSIGVGFVSATVVDDIIYDDQVNAEYDDLFFTLAVLFDSAPLAAGEEMTFVADTDVLKVPEPATTAMILTGLLFGAARLRKQSRSN